MLKLSLLDVLKEQYAIQSPTLGRADSYDLFKHKNNLNQANSYSDAVSSLFADTKKGLSSYGENSRIFNNKGLQNSGYSDFVDVMSRKMFERGKDALKSSYGRTEAENLSSYASYLAKFKDKQDSTKRSVLSHLVNNDILDINTAIAYGVNAGLSFDDAKALGESAYQTTKEKIANEILKQSVSLGLDQAGAKKLAMNMGLSITDAAEIADEVAEMLKYYSSISKDYLAFLEERSK